MGERSKKLERAIGISVRRGARAAWLWGGLCSSAYAGPLTNLNQNACFRIMARIAHRTAETERGLREHLNDRDSIEEYGIPIGDPRYSVRRTLVGAARNMGDGGAFRRQVLVPALEADMKHASDNLSRRLDEAQKAGTIDEEAQVHDLVLIGASAHSAIAKLALAENSPGLKVLTVESSDDVARTFSTEAFRMNSSNGTDRLDEPPVPRQRQNLNQLPGGVIQVSDITADKYPVARDLADVILMNHAAVNSPILFGHEVVQVEDRLLSGEPGASQWPARYRIRFQNGHEVYSRGIANLSGISNKLNLEGMDAGSAALVTSERKIYGPKGEPPKIESVDQMLRDAMNNPNAYEQHMVEKRPDGTKKNLKIALIGPGDSSNTAIEWLMGTGPGGYGDSTASSGKFEKVVWFGQNKTTCDELLNSFRPRYTSGIVGAVKSELVEPRDVKVTKITKLANGQFEITSQDGTGRLTKEVVDRVILGTGSVDETSAIYEGMTRASERGVTFNREAPFNRSSFLAPVTGQVPTLDPGGVKLGKRLLNPDGAPPDAQPQKVYFGGPGAGPLGTDAEYAGVGANSVSLFVNGKRTRQLAIQIGQELRSDPQAKPLKKLSPPPMPVLGAATANTGSVTYLLRRPNADSPIFPRAQAHSPLLLKARLAAVLGEYVLPENGATLFLNRAGDGSFILRLKPSVDGNAALDLAKRIQRDSDLMDLVASLIGEGGANNQVRLTLLPPTKQKAGERGLPDMAIGRGQAPVATDLVDARDAEFSGPLITATAETPTTPRHNTLPVFLSSKARPGSKDGSDSAAPSASADSKLLDVVEVDPVLEGLLESQKPNGIDQLPDPISPGDATRYARYQSDLTAHRRTVERFLLGGDPGYVQVGIEAFFRLPASAQARVLDSGSFGQMDFVLRNKLVRRLRATVDAPVVVAALARRLELLDRLKQRLGDGYFSLAEPLSSGESANPVTVNNSEFERNNTSASLVAGFRESNRPLFGMSLPEKVGPRDLERAKAVAINVRSLPIVEQIEIFNQIATGALFQSRPRSPGQPRPTQVPEEVQLLLVDSLAANGQNARFRLLALDLLQKQAFAPPAVRRRLAEIVVVGFRRAVAVPQPVGP